MSLPFAITADARSDIEDAQAWYETFQIGRGDTFIVELRDHLIAIGENPERYGRVHRTIRAAPLPDSKFIVYYRVELTQMVVTAVQHASANPQRWKRRR